VLERLYQQLGASQDSATRHARLAYSIYLGVAALKRSDPHEQVTDAEIEARVHRFVESVVPPDSAHTSA
jgi:hypothetical protein